MVALSAGWPWVYTVRLSGQHAVPANLPLASCSCGNYRLENVLRIFQYCLPGQPYPATHAAPVYILNLHVN